MGVEEQQEGLIEALGASDDNELILESTIVSVGEIEKQLSSSSSASKQLNEDKEVFLSSDILSDIIEPPFNPLLGVLYLEKNTRLSRSVRIYARNTVGLGWEAVPKRLTVKTSNEKADDLRDEAKDEIEILDKFYSYPSDASTFSDLCYQVIFDRETTGNGYWEVVRDIKGRIKNIYYMPSHTVRVRKGGMGYVQIRGSTKSYFKSFGDEREINSETGKEGSVPFEKAANEIIHFKVFTPKSTYYGSPRWLSCSPALAGTRLASERNVNFFANDAPQPLRAKVLTPYGWSLMGELKTGDEVIGSDGKPHKITEVIPQGDKEVYRVHFLDGTSTECTLGHVWTVSNNHDRQNNVTRNMTLRELLSDGLQYPSGPYKWAVPMVDPIEYKSDCDLPLDPYLLGVLLGNGWFGRAEVGFAFCSKDADEAEGILSDLLPNNTELRKRDKCPKLCVEFGIRKLRGDYKNPIFDIVKDLNLWGVKARDKFIPEPYLLASVKDRISLLQGLIDADGCVWDTAVRYTTVSTTLAANIVELVGSLGGTVTVKPIKNKDLLQLTIRQLPKHITPARLSKKANRYSPTSAIRWRTMSSVEKVGVDQTQCIRTDSKDSLYITDDFILTHNTPRLVITVTGAQLTPETINDIRNFLAVEGKGVDNAHRALVLQAKTRQAIVAGVGKEASINVVPLTVGVEDDASFTRYMEMNNEEVREAFGIDRVFYSPTGIGKTGGLIGRIITNEQVFGPSRESIQFIINSTISKEILDAELEEGVDFRDRKAHLRFKAPALTDPLDRAREDALLARAGSKTPNDMRIERGLDPFPDTEEFEFAKYPITIYLEKLKLNRPSTNPVTPGGKKPTDPPFNVPTGGRGAKPTDNRDPDETRPGAGAGTSMAASMDDVDRLLISDWEEENSL